MLELRCGDVISGCDGVVLGETEDEVMAQASRHAEEAHGLSEVDPATERALVAAIHPA